MKNKEKTIKVLEFENGDLVLGVDGDNYFVKTSDGIFVYGPDEMKEIYGYLDDDENN